MTLPEQASQDGCDYRRQNPVPTLAREALERQTMKEVEQQRELPPHAGPRYRDAWICGYQSVEEV